MKPRKEDYSQFRKKINQSILVQHPTYKKELLRRLLEDPIVDNVLDNVFVGFSDVRPFANELAEFFSENIRRNRYPWAGWKPDLIQQMITKYAKDIAPPRMLRHDRLEVRRMDNLAALLAVSLELSPCIASAFVDNELVIFSNQGKPGKRPDEFIQKKQAVIRDFLIEISKDIVDLQGNIPENVVLTPRTELLARVALEKIVADESGGYSQEIGRARLLNCLLKLGHHYLLGMYTQGQQGFTDAQRALLLKPAVINPPTLKRPPERLTLHAELGIMLYATEHGISDNIDIGVSKLCCQLCAAELDKKGGVGYRGTHNLLFPGTWDVSGEFKGQYFQYGDGRSLIEPPSPTAPLYAPRFFPAPTTVPSGDKESTHVVTLEGIKVTS